MNDLDPATPLRKVSPRELALAGFFLFAFFTFNIWNCDLWHVDEARFAQVSREMMQSGNYLSPTVNAESYTEKPPLLFWLIAAISTPFGDVSGESARIALALAAVAAVFATFRLAEMMFDTRTALWSCIILATCWRFFWQARTVQIDMLLTACTTFSLLFFWMWHTRRQTRHLILFYLAIGFGMLAKGPPALVFPFLMIVTFYWGRRTDRKQTHYVIGSAFSIAMLLAWLIPARMMIGGTETETVEQGILNNAYRQTIGRLLEGGGHPNPPWYYFETIPVDLLPWTFLLPPALYTLWRNRTTSEPYRLLLCWILPAFVFFSLSSGKRSIYLLPLLPTLAIVMGAWITQAAAGIRTATYRRFAFGWMALLALVAAALVYLLIVNYPGSAPIAGAISLVLILATLLSAVITVRRNPRRFLSAFPAHVMIVLLVTAYAFLPIRNERQSVREISAPLYTLSQEHVDYEVHTVGFSDLRYVFYAAHPIIPLLHESIYFGSGKTSVIKTFRSVAADASSKTDVANQHDPEIKEAALRIRHELSDNERKSRWLTDGLAELAKDLSDPKPVFFIIDERDFEWAEALEPSIHDYTVLLERPIHGHTMILLANHAATMLVQDAPATQ